MAIKESSFESSVATPVRVSEITECGDENENVRSSALIQELRRRGGLKEAVGNADAVDSSVISVEAAEDRSEIVSVDGGLESQRKSGEESGDKQVAGGGGSRGADDDATSFKYSFKASSDVHRQIKESPLSSDAIFRQSHAGLVNLCIIVLVSVNSRLIIENLMKYGLLIRMGCWFSSKSLRDWPVLMCGLSLVIFPIAAFLVEKLVQRKYITDPVAVTSHILITTATIVYPILVILWCDSAIISGVALMLLTCTVWLKLVSYAHTNYDMRALSKSFHEVESSNLDCPYEVSFKSLMYFMVAPTLCYQLCYPRNSCIRKGWLVNQFLKLILFTGLMGFIIEQYINPIVQNSQHPLKGNLLNAVERVLKLSVPNLYVWLCMFYCFFHLWLNILAELLRFGDREFYKDWWNARTIDEYWRMWNMPVHKWIVRHIYFPCIRRGAPKGVAVLISFFISAFFHELCIAVPCRMFKCWAFIGIMFQVPLVILTNFLQNKYRSSVVGNMIFWCFFSIFGQPMCVLLYYHDLMNRMQGIE
ncbi:unnamed protein product [Cuscuta epithymum]|uniref:O-acyltransferase n=1 Tax=Cuscuta epithymum TaxID=186058 RepID=A0AAV0G783_9ASTE|nr:unnamed protein product [Cuscuta epithymum]